MVKYPLLAPSLMHVMTQNGGERRRQNHYNEKLPLGKREKGQERALITIVSTDVGDNSMVVGVTMMPLPWDGG